MTVFVLGSGWRELLAGMGTEEGQTMSPHPNSWPARSRVEAVAGQMYMTGAQETDLHLISSSEIKTNALEGKRWAWLCHSPAV